MYFERFYDEKLAQASYLVGCQRTGEAIVLDSNRDADVYVSAAKRNRLRITQVTETHIHADFASGVRELAARVGARMLLSAEGGRDWQYEFAEADGARLLRDGDVVELGAVRLDVMHTPGHTPEHLSFILTDTAASENPMGIFTGDFVFVGDVGRPDLLERAARVSGSTESAARALFASLRRFEQLPDYLQLWPGHGAGSACGKALGAVPQSTVGYERMVNWALQIADADAFVRAVVDGQTEPPRYFGTMKRLNRAGVPVLGALPDPPRLAAGDVQRMLREGATVADLRLEREYAAASLGGTINLPYNRSFTTWAGALLPYDRDVVLLAGHEAATTARRAARDLALIGIDNVVGYADVEALRAAGLLSQSTRSVSSSEAAPTVDGEWILDVRNRSEWEEGHIPGAHHVPLAELPDRIAEVPRDRTVLVHCESGARSAIAASYLAAHGYTEVVNLSDGFSGWRKGGLPIES